MTIAPRRPDAAHLLWALASVAAITAISVAWLHITNATTISLSYLLVVLFTAASSRLWVAVTTSIAAMLCINFFFIPPVSTFTIAEPHNWIALFAFLIVSLVASRLSSLARDRQRDALARRDELAHLFDLSRDILLTHESAEAIPALARHIARRFDLDYVAICLPSHGDVQRYEAGPMDLQGALRTSVLQSALADAERTFERQDRSGTEAGHEVITGSASDPIRLVPLRVGTRTIGLLAAAGRPIDPGTLDTVASVAAIAIERAHFLEERKQAELAQRSAELKSTLLASLAHDLRTPLTAIRVAANNLRGPWLSVGQMSEQAEIVLSEVERLSRLFQNILEMTTIDAGAIAPALQWVHPMEIVEAAQAQVDYALRGHDVVVPSSSDEQAVRVDPRLTAAALAHLLENAAQYSPAGSKIAVDYHVAADGLQISIQDQGPGIAPADLEHLFDRYYRGTEAQRHAAGSGMGLAITRGLLAAEGGRVWAENQDTGGARFSIFVPAAHRPL
jgi:two-component system sensor histidine kinase KdpD